MGTSQPPSPTNDLDEDDDPELPEGIMVRIRASLGGEQSFHLTGDVLTFESTGPIYDWASGQVQLSQEQVEAINSLLHRVRVGPVPPGLPGLDGETTTVTISEGKNRVELEYWDAPKPWKPLEKLVKIVKQIASERQGVI